VRNMSFTWWEMNLKSTERKERPRLTRGGGGGKNNKRKLAKGPEIVGNEPNYGVLEGREEKSKGREEPYLPQSPYE